MLEADQIHNTILDISQVSAMWWDQNEEYSQFTGDHAFLYKGYSLLTDALAEGLDIQLSEEVRKLELRLKYICEKSS